MLRETGPVIRTPSACRGDATNWIPNLPRSQASVLGTFVSASQALPPAALTCRSLRERPKGSRAFSSRAAGGGAAGPSTMNPSRARAARRCSRVNAIAPAGHAGTHAPQTLCATTLLGP
jgi:hypothetical protein